jgi:hypothetical protein
MAWIRFCQQNTITNVCKNATVMIILNIYKAIIQKCFLSQNNTKKRDTKKTNGWFIKNLMERKDYSFSPFDKRLLYLR